MIAASCRWFLFCVLVQTSLVHTSWCAGNPTINPSINPPLTVLMDFEGPHSEASLISLRQSLNQILSPGGFDINVQVKSELPPHAQFGELVVFRMKGSCSMSSVTAAPLANKLGPLALAFTSDGEVLHFGEVECDRVRHMLQRVLGLSVSLKNQQTYGTALAVVIAHEVYHMLGNAINHTHKGLTKASLSADDLTDSKMKLPPIAVATMKRYFHNETLRESQ